MKHIRKRLFLDIETSQMVVRVWALNDPANQYISHLNIEKEAGIICICWKWAGSKRVESLNWDTKQSDRSMLLEFLPVLESATEVIAHNGDRFDLPWIRGRCLTHQIPMNPNLPTIDTLKKSRQKFRLPSNRLDYLGQSLIGEQKLKAGLELWQAIQKDNCPKAMARMLRYCRQDVRLLEKVFDRMAPYLEPKTSIAQYAGECPECGGGRVGNHGTRRTASGIVTNLIRCKDCGKNHTIGHAKFLAGRKL